jgi:hypothetical protein
VRWTLGSGVLLLGVSFLACRARWARYFASTSVPGTATWLPKLFPFFFFAVNTICAVAIFSGYLGTK